MVTYGQLGLDPTNVGGVNLLAMASNGQRVIGNLLDALQPVLLDGARQCAAEKKAERDGAQKK